MSSLNVYLTPEQGFIATDSTAYDASGAVLAWVAKTVALPSVRSAIGTRGRVDVGWRLAGMIGTGTLRGARSIDDVLPDLETLFLDAFEASVWQAPAADFEGWIVGWSMKEQRIVAETFVYAINESLAGFTGFRRARVGDGLYLGPPLLHEFACAYRHVHAPDTFIDAAERQRALYAKYAPNHVVGGDLMLTTVSRCGVEQRIVHAWPDRLTVSDSAEAAA